MKALIFIPDKEKNSVRTAVICDSAILRAKDPFFVPDARPWRGWILRGVRIDRLGKSIKPEFASRYYNEALTAVHSFTSLDEYEASRWCRDGSLIVSEPVNASALTGTSKAEIDDVISFFSRSMTLKTGDMVFIADMENAFHLDSPPSNMEVQSVNGFPPMKYKIR